MGIQDRSEDTILVDLSGEPEMGNELITVMKMVRDRGDRLGNDRRRLTKMSPFWRHLYAARCALIGWWEWSERF